MATLLRNSQQSAQSEQEHRGLENPSAILKIRIIKLGWRSKKLVSCVCFP